ncbi:MAG: hypothetical protein AABW65_02280 [Nanoarchaeota archaeon]
MKKRIIKKALVYTGLLGLIFQTGCSTIEKKLGLDKIEKFFEERDEKTPEALMAKHGYISYNKSVPDNIGLQTYNSPNLIDTTTVKPEQPAIFTITPDLDAIDKENPYLILRILAEDKKDKGYIAREEKHVIYYEGLQKITNNNTIAYSYTFPKAGLIGTRGNYFYEWRKEEHKEFRASDIFNLVPFFAIAKEINYPVILKEGRFVIQ